MELNEFIGKVVVNTTTGRHFRLHRITAPEILVVTLTPEQSGHYGFYAYKTINGDPFSNGTLVFEDDSLNQPFRMAYDAHCHSENGFWEEYGYWMRRD